VVRRRTVLVAKILRILAELLLRGLRLYKADFDEYDRAVTDHQTQPLEDLPQRKVFKMRIFNCMRQPPSIWSRMFNMSTVTLRGGSEKAGSLVKPFICIADSSNISQMS
jgi:hypothetical protein